MTDLFKSKNKYREKGGIVMENENLPIGSGDSALSTDMAIIEAMEGTAEVTEPEVEVVTEETEEVVESPEEDTEAKEEKEVEKPASKEEEKTHQAFARMRTENKALKTEKEAVSSNMSRAMSVLGFKSWEEMESALEELEKQKEIESGGTEESFSKRKELTQKEQELSEKEKKYAEYESEKQLDNLSRDVSTFASQYDLTPEQIIAELEKNDVSVNDLLESSNRTLMLKGIMADTILEAKTTKATVEAQRPSVASQRLPATKRDAKTQDGVADLVKLSLAGLE